MAAIVLQTIPKHGELEDVVMTAGNLGGDTFANDGATMLLIDNTDAAQQTVTVTSVADPFGRTGDVVITLGAGELGMMGPFQKNLWNGAGGLVTITPSAITVKYAALKFTSF